MILDLVKLGQEFQDALRERMSAQLGSAATREIAQELFIEQQALAIAALREENAQLLRVVNEQRDIIELQRVQLGGRPRRRGHAKPPEEQGA